MDYVIAAGVAFAIGWFLAFRNTSSREQELQSRERALQSEKAAAGEDYRHQERELAEQRAASMREIERKGGELEKFERAWREEYERLLNQARQFRSELDGGFLKGRQWLANAFSEYVETRDAELECALVVKPNPAWKSAQIVAELRAKRAEMARKLKMLQYQVASYEEYFPVLADYRDAILDEVVDMRGGASEALADLDPALGLGFLTKEEFEKLSTSEKFQLALERYWKRNKSNVEIGRLYERFIGYLYESDGWTVRYHGVLKGFEDFGRDLICTKDGSTHIVQCKCWSKAKLIREKHIMQLFGTCILFRLTEKHQNTSAVFAATTELSEEAALVARELGVSIRRQELERYPMIKCNVNDANGERIYHLPFDQQYDRIVIGDQAGEFYASTVAEAETAGFRRAFRWQGNDREGAP